MTFPLGPLSRDVGVRAGRLVPPSGAEPQEGSAAFVLGADRRGDRRTLRVGDSVEVRQWADWVASSGELTHLLSLAFGGLTLPAVGVPLWVNGNETANITSRPDGTVVHVGPDPYDPLATFVTSNQGAGDDWTFEATRTAGGSASTGTVFPAGTAFWVFRDGLTPTTGTFFPAVFLRARAKLRAVREAMPLDTRWKLSLVVGGTEVWSRGLSSANGAGDDSRDQEVVDAAALIRGAAQPSGVTVAWRLELTGSATDEVEAELPAAYLDAIVLDASEEPIVYNRLPEPGQTNVMGSGTGSWVADPGAARVRFDFTVPTVAPFADLNAAPVTAVYTMNVYVNGVLACSNATGPFVDHNGYQTTVTDLHSGRTARFEVLYANGFPHPAYPPGYEVVVRLEVLAAGTVLDQSWSFFTEDLLAPVLLAAQAQDALTVRVTASEDLLAASAAGGNDALNPANWTVELRSTSLADGLPAVTPEVLSVASVAGSSVFDLVLDRELTRGALYAAVAGPLADLSFSANLMAPPGNEALFTGFQPPWPAGRSFDLLSLLPDVNVGEDETEDLHRFVACLQEVTDLLLAEVDRWPDILDPDVAPRAFLQLMLRDLGNPFSFALSEADERRLLQVLVPIYQLKGTDPGIINAVRFFVGLEVAIVVPAFDGVWVLGESELGVETYLGSDDLYDRLSFWVQSPVALTDEQRLRIRGIVEYMKRAETHFRGFIEPAPPPPLPDHWELGLSLLGVETTLH